MQECHVAGIELFVAGSNAPEMLDACEEALDQIAVLVQILAVGPGLFAVGARRDERLCCTGPNELHRRHRSKEFLKFLRSVDQNVPKISWCIW